MLSFKVLTIFLITITQNLTEALNYSGKKLLEQYFCPEDLLKYTENQISEKIKEVVEIGDVLDMKITPNMSLVS